VGALDDGGEESLSDFAGIIREEKKKLVKQGDAIPRGDNTEGDRLVGSDGGLGQREKKNHLMAPTN
jgi:hypothetical protein